MSLKGMSLKGMNEDRASATELIDLYIQYAQVFDRDEMVVLNGVFQQCIDFFGIERTLPPLPDEATASTPPPPPIQQASLPSATGAFSREKYGDIVRRELLDREEEKYSAQVQKVRDAITTIDAVPATWSGTKAAYEASVKPQRDEFARQRTELNQTVKRYHDGSLLQVEYDVMEKEIDALFTEHAGVPKPEQLSRYIKELEQQSFEVVNGLDYYPTPYDVVETMVGNADIYPNMNVLEPSAGKGDILDALRARFGSTITIDAVEYSPSKDIMLWALILCSTPLLAARKADFPCSMKKSSMTGLS